MRIGNYVAIISYGDEELYATVEHRSRTSTTLATSKLDMKYDSRDGSYKLLDFNPRQGRSSFFVTLAGNNLARFVGGRRRGGEEGPSRTMPTTVPLGGHVAPYRAALHSPRRWA
jgi:D-aspartate ligase